MTVSVLEHLIHPDGLQYDFGTLSLHTDGSLFRDSTVVPLPPKELAILRLLLSRAGEIVSADQLRLSAWGNTHVSADSLPRCISSLRAHLECEDCIQTVYKHGYRFNVPVEQTLVAPAGVPAQKNGQWRTRAHGLPRLAILPFATGAGVPDPLGAGIAEETMLRLSRLCRPVAEIMASNSVFALAARGNTAQEIGKSLHADLALTGTITALPLHYRLRAEMVRVSDAVQLWVEDFLVPRNLLVYADAHIAKRISARIQDTFASFTPSTTEAISSQTG